MIFYLRTKDNKTVGEVELYNTASSVEKIWTELSVYVNIIHYSQLLLDNQHRSVEVANDFYDFCELRGWLWEVYFRNRENDGSHLLDVQKKIRAKFDELAEKYGLSVVED